MLGNLPLGEGITDIFKIGYTSFLLFWSLGPAEVASDKETDARKKVLEGNFLIVGGALNSIE